MTAVYQNSLRHVFIPISQASGDEDLSKRAAATKALAQKLSRLICKYEPVMADISNLPRFSAQEIEETEDSTRALLKGRMRLYCDLITSQEDEITTGFLYLACLNASSGPKRSRLLYRVLLLWTVTCVMPENGWWTKYQIKILEEPYADYTFGGNLVDRIFVPLRDKVFAELQQKMHSRSYKKYWLEIILTTFILLKSYDHYRAQTFAPVDWDLPKTHPYGKAFKEQHRGAAVLLTYWHKLEGQKLFDDLVVEYDDAKRELQDFGVEESDIVILRQLARRARARRDEWKKLAKTDSRTEPLFSRQMFQENGKPPNWVYN